VWKKTLSYLGLVEEDEYDEAVGDPQAQAPVVLSDPAPVPAHRGGRAARQERAMIQPAPDVGEAVVRTIPQRRVSPATTIHKSEPKRFNDARDLADKFRDGVPVIMNLQGTEDSTARRLVDFASGLVFGLDGKIETVANRVYLLTPAEMEVSAEERERLREGGFYNQL
jgi:cell division inhibitor SepF